MNDMTIVHLSDLHFGTLGAQSSKLYDTLDEIFKINAPIL